MSEAEVGAQAPTEVIAKTFTVFWANGDDAFSVFEGITGSNLEDGLLFLIKDGIEHLINMDHVCQIMIHEDE